MSIENNEASISQNNNLITEHIVCQLWKNPLDSLPFIGNGKEIFHVFNTSEKCVEVFAKFNKTDLEFHDLDFTSFPLTFWQIYGENVSGLAFNYCVLNYETVFSIINYCKNLEIFALRTSDKFIMDKNPTFSETLKNIIDIEACIPSVKTVDVEINIFSEAGKDLDESVLGILNLFPNTEKLSLIRHIENEEFSISSCLMKLENTYPFNSSSELTTNLFGSKSMGYNSWMKIFQFLMPKCKFLKALHFEFHSILDVNKLWKNDMKEWMNAILWLQELTLEVPPYEEHFQEEKIWSKFIKRLNFLKSLKFKLLLKRNCRIESSFLNTFIRDIIIECHQLEHLNVERLQKTNEERNRCYWEWEFTLESLRDLILCSNLETLRIHVDNCNILISENHAGLDRWNNFSLELLSLNYFSGPKSTDGRLTHETMAVVISKLKNLKYLHLGGDIDGKVLHAIWTHQKNLKGLALHFMDPSYVTERTFTESISSTFENISTLKSLQYLKLEDQMRYFSENGHFELDELKSPCFEISSLLYVYVKNNNDNPEFLIDLESSLTSAKKLRTVYIEYGVKFVAPDFWFIFCHHLPNLCTLYIKNSHPNSNKYSTFDYKELFRYCISLKLLIHECSAMTNRWFRAEHEKVPKRITDDNQLLLIGQDFPEMPTEIWS